MLDKIKKILMFVKGRKKERWELEEKLLKRCPGLIYEDLEISEKELEECERMVQEAMKKVTCKCDC